jgi:hypothetical protein
MYLMHKRSVFILLVLSSKLFNVTAPSDDLLYCGFRFEGLFFKDGRHGCHTNVGDQNRIKYTQNKYSTYYPAPDLPMSRLGHRVETVPSLNSRLLVPNIFSVEGIKALFLNNNTQQTGRGGLRMPNLRVLRWWKPGVEILQKEKITRKDQRLAIIKQKHAEVVFIDRDESEWDEGMRLPLSSIIDGRNSLSWYFQGEDDYYWWNFGVAGERLNVDRQKEYRHIYEETFKKSSRVKEGRHYFKRDFFTIQLEKVRQVYRRSNPIAFLIEQYAGYWDNKMNLLVPFTDWGAMWEMGEQETWIAKNDSSACIPAQNFLQFWVAPVLRASPIISSWPARWPILFYSVRNHRYRDSGCGDKRTYGWYPLQNRPNCFRFHKLSYDENKKHFRPEASSLIWHFLYHDMTVSRSAITAGDGLLKEKERKVLLDRLFEQYDLNIGNYFDSMANLFQTREEKRNTLKWWGRRALPFVKEWYINSPWTPFHSAQNRRVKLLTTDWHRILKAFSRPSERFFHRKIRSFSDEVFLPTLLFEACEGKYDRQRWTTCGGRVPLKKVVSVMWNVKGSNKVDSAMRLGVWYSQSPLEDSLKDCWYQTTATAGKDKWEQLWPSHRLHVGFNFPGRKRCSNAEERCLYKGNWTWFRLTPLSSRGRFVENSWYTVDRWWHHLCGLLSQEHFFVIKMIKQEKKLFLPADGSRSSDDHRICLLLKQIKNLVMQRYYINALCKTTILKGHRSKVNK